MDWTFVCHGLKMFFFFILEKNEGVFNVGSESHVTLSLSSLMGEKLSLMRAVTHTQRESNIMVMARPTALGIFGNLAEFGAYRTCKSKRNFKIKQELIV